MGIFDSIGSIGSAVAGPLANYWANERTNKQNKSLYYESLAYNSPAAQMQRYKDAGLNPYLAISGGNPGNAAQIPTMKSPDLSSDIVGSYVKIAEAKNLKAQNDNLHAQNQLIQAQTAQAFNATSMHTMDTLAKVTKMRAETSNVEQLRALNKLEYDIRSRDHAINIKYDLPSYSESAGRQLERNIARLGRKGGYHVGKAAAEGYKSYSKLRNSVAEMVRPVYFRSDDSASNVQLRRSIKENLVPSWFKYIGVR